MDRSSSAPGTFGVSIIDVSPISMLHRSKREQTGRGRGRVVCFRSGGKQRRSLDALLIAKRAQADYPFSRGGPIRAGWNNTAAVIVQTSASAINFPMLEVPG